MEFDIGQESYQPDPNVDQLYLYLGAGLYSDGYIFKTTGADIKAEVGLKQPVQH